MTGINLDIILENISDFNQQGMYMSVFSFGSASNIMDAIGKSLAIIEFKLDGTVISANENFLSILGYNLNEIVGQHHKIFVDPAEAASSAYRDFWAKLARGEFDRRQYKRITKSGKEIWIGETN